MENQVARILLDISVTFVQCLGIASGILLFTAGIFELAERFAGDD